MLGSYSVFQGWESTISDFEFVSLKFKVTTPFTPE